MTTDEALREILRAVDAWDNDADFGLDTDEEMRFGCDAEFLDYVGAVAREALTLPRTDAPNTNEEIR